VTVRADADDLIAFLNEVLALDREFVSALVNHRVPVKSGIQEHPSIQVGEVDGVLSAGILGLLNGYLGTIDSGPYAGWGPIIAVFDDDEGVVEFRRTPQ
jgi:hypothetical protein